MKKLTKKAVKTAFALALPVSVFIVAFLLYGRHEAETLTEDSMLREDTKLRRDDSIKLSRIQASIDKELDSLERFPTINWTGSFYNDPIFDTLQNTSSIAGESKDFSIQKDKADTQGNGALHGPSALFTRIYTLAVGKPLPVTVSWAPDSTLLPREFQLLTITVNDIAGEKAGFTLADPFAVLLYSGPRYAVNDKISIEDEHHNFDISVVEVHPGSVRIAFASHLNDDIVSRLKALE